MARSGNNGKLREQDPNSFQIRFGQVVRRYRDKRGLSQMDVARLVYSDETRTSGVSDVERGRNEPQADTIARYRDALEIPEEEIDACRSPVPSGAAEELGLRRELLESLVQRFEHDNPDAPDHELTQFLKDKATEYRELKARLSALAEAETRIANQMAAAQGALDQGRFEEADEILSRAEDMQQSEHTLVQVRKQAEIREARGEAALLKGDADAAYAHFRAAAEFFAPFDPLEGAARRNEYLRNLYEHGARYASSGLSHAVDLATENLAAYPRETMPADWAMTQNNLGNALQSLGERAGGADGAERLAAAVTAFEGAMEVFDEIGVDRYEEIARSNLEDAKRQLAELGVAPERG